MAKRRPPELVTPSDTEFVYLGPTILGKIQNGTILFGTKEEILARMPVAAEFEEIKTLIVPVRTLPADLKKVKTPGNALHAIYKALAGKL